MVASATAGADVAVVIAVVAATAATAAIAAAVVDVAVVTVLARKSGSCYQAWTSCQGRQDQDH